MGIIFTLIVFILCIVWFHRRINAEPRGRLLPVILVFLVSSVVAFFLSFMLWSEYLDGFFSLLAGGIFAVVFWIWTTILIILKFSSPERRKHLLPYLLQNSIVLIFPVLIWITMSDASLKIGG